MPRTYYTHWIGGQHSHDLESYEKIQSFGLFYVSDTYRWER